MNNRHKKTLAAIFENPTRSDIEWKEIGKALLALGALLKEDSGSRVRFDIGGVSAVFHRPHPQKEAQQGSIKAVRAFLEKAGVYGV